MTARVEGKTAVLGLGIIGSRAADRLVALGCEVTTWSRTGRGRGDEVRRVVEAVDGATRISIYLKDGPAVRSAMGDAAGCLGADVVVMNHSTVDLATTRWLADFCAERGCRFLDAPFTGSKLAAGSGQLVYYIGGDPSLADEMDSFLALTSRLRMRCGEVGAATVVKLATNLISACSVQAMAEALAIAVAHGVPAENFIRAVGENASGSPLAAMKLPAMAAGEFETHFSLDNMAKDGGYARELAAAAGLEVPAIDAVWQRMRDLCGRGLGDSDYSALGKPYLDDR